jgi:hypothetical protein
VSAFDFLHSFYAKGVKTDLRNRVLALTNVKLASVEFAAAAFPSE